MATVRAQRQFNSVMSGATNAAALQTLLGTNSNLADWQQVMNERGKARLLSNSSIALPNVFQSALAVEQYFVSRAGAAEFSLSPIGMAILAQFPSGVSGSNGAMTGVFSSGAIRANVFANRTLATTLLQSTFMPNQWQYFWNGGASSMPQAIQRNPSGGSFATFHGVGFGNGVWVAVGGGTNRVVRSTDNGATWVNASNGVSDAAGTLRGVAYGAGTFVAVGDGSSLLTSSDGNSNWVARSVGFGANVNCIAFANSLFVVGTSAGAIWTSADGINWTQRASGLNSVRSLGFGNGRWIAGANSQTLYTSTNGTSWTIISTSVFGGNNAAVRIVLFGNGVWLAAGDSGCIARSTDGTNFTFLGAGSIPGTNFSSSWSISAGVWANGLFIIHQRDANVTCATLDGITWAQGQGTIGNWASTSVMSNMNAGAFANGQTVFGGDSGAIQTMF